MTKDCSECKHFDVFHTSRACHDCKPWLASTDCFSRADAIEVVHRHFTDALDDLPTETDEDGDVIYKDTKSVNELLKHNKAISKELKALPSTDRPIGEWIDVNGDGSLWKCNQCKDTACCKGNFCPTCGAKMIKNSNKKENNDAHKVPLYVYASWDRSEE